MIAIRVLALTVVYFMCFSAVSAAVIPRLSPEPDPGQAGQLLAALLAVSFLNAVVFAYVILNSRWTGWKLILSIFVICYGVTTVMGQIETAVFVTTLPPGLLPRLFLSGALIAAIFSPLAVLILGKRKSLDAEGGEPSRLRLTAKEWAISLSILAIAYIVIYFSFGYFIAWKSVAVRTYYGGQDPGNFLAHMATVVRDMPWLFPLQALRALLWVALAVPVIRMTKGEWWKAGLAVALLFGVAMNAQLLLPNPLMPQEVRMVHLLETASSNFLFGWLVVLVLTRFVTSKHHPGSNN